MKHYFGHCCLALALLASIGWDFTNVLQEMASKHFLSALWIVSCNSLFLKNVKQILLFLKKYVYTHTENYFLLWFFCVCPYICIKLQLWAMESNHLTLPHFLPSFSNTCMCDSIWFYTRYSTFGMVTPQCLQWLCHTMEVDGAEIHRF